MAPPPLRDKNGTPKNRRLDMTGDMRVKSLTTMDTQDRAK